MEEWRAVIIRGINRFEVSSEGRVRNGHTGLVYALINSKGYLKLRVKEGPRVFYESVHRIVAKAFLDNPDKKAEVNHRNGIKTDNRVINLEWNTHAENMKHARKLNLFARNKGPRRCKQCEIYREMLGIAGGLVDEKNSATRCG